jgi:general secretion pathway protein L
MTEPTAILARMPLVHDDDPMLWLVSDDAITGTIHLSQIGTAWEQAALEAMPVMLLVPAAHSTFKRVQPQGLEPRQELAVAKIAAQEQALATVQAAAAFDDTAMIQIATMDAGLLQNALAQLHDHGLRVIAAVPFGALFQPGVDEIWHAEIDGHGMLCSADLCIVDEPSLAKLFFGDANIRTLSEGEIADAIIRQCSAPRLNFLEGMAIRRYAKPLFSEANRKWAKRLAVLAACLFLLGGISYWAKLKWAIAREDKASLVAAKSIDPSINDIAAAETAVDAELFRKGIEPAKPAMLIAILWQSTKAQENVALTDLNIAGNGLLSATLSAPDTNSINAALLSIQRAGYQITATPRRDASGLTLVDLTVKAP